MNLKPKTACALLAYVLFASVPTAVAHAEKMEAESEKQQAIDMAGEFLKTTDTEALSCVVIPSTSESYQCAEKINERSQAVVRCEIGKSCYRFK